MNIVFCGKPGSGKSSICNFMCDNLRYDKIVTYTTRDKRDGEQDGVEYNFVDKDYFLKYIDKFCAVSVCNNNFYGTMIDDLKNADNKIIILDLNGVKELDSMPYRKNFYIIYIDCKESERIERMINRGDSEDDIKMRYNENTLYDFIDYIDFVVVNDRDINTCVTNILSGIR